jgi:hypothetical protein
MIASPWLVQIRQELVGEPPTLWFIAFLGLTVLLLGLDIVTGKRRRRRLHLACVACTWPVLVTTIVLAETVGKFWRFPFTPLTVHLCFAYAASGAAFLASLAGFLHLKGRIARGVHARLAWLFVGLALAATLTGIWIFTVGTRR